MPRSHVVIQGVVDHFERSKFHLVAVKAKLGAQRHVHGDQFFRAVGFWRVIACHCAAQFSVHIWFKRVGVDWRSVALLSRQCVPTEPRIVERRGSDIISVAIPSLG